VIILKTPAEIEIMARASRLVAETLAMLRREVRAGVTTEDLDRLAEQFIRSHGGTPAFKGYRNYPKTLCASINDQVVHGIPSKRALKEGDIIGLDLGAIVDGFYGNRLSDISHAVQRHAEAAGFSVVTDFVGHGIGRQLHEEPQVPNYGKPGQGPRLQEGMVLAIEPMINMGNSGVRVLDDRWTAVTTDGSLSAHFEHTIAIQSSGPPRILTQVPELIAAC
jgi:methionyl aminopeptidase